MAPNKLADGPTTAPADGDASSLWCHVAVDCNMSQRRHRGSSMPQRTHLLTSVGHNRKTLDVRKVTDAITSSRRPGRDAPAMIDLHCHILPGIDDGAEDVGASLAMAQAFVADGISTVACTPHILPGVYQNTGPQIRSAVADLQRHIDEAGIALRLVPGADNHIVPDLVGGLRAGRLLTIADSRYALVEPPHHVPPPRLEESFFELMVSGYVPILTHPERLTWINKHYDMMARLADGGVWMQVTAGSLTGTFGRNARYWAEKMLCEGRVHILATDAHDTVKRPPELGRARTIAAGLVGEREAEMLVVARPAAVLANFAPGGVERPAPVAGEPEVGDVTSSSSRSDSGRAGGIAGRLRRLFE